MAQPDRKASRIDRVWGRIKHPFRPSGHGSASNVPYLVPSEEELTENATAESIAPVTQGNPMAKTTTAASTTATAIEGILTDNGARQAPSHATEASAESIISIEATIDVAETVSTPVSNLPHPNVVSTAPVNPETDSVPDAGLQSKLRAPKWNEALSTFKQENPKRYDALERVTQESIAKAKQLTDLKLPKTVTENPQSHEVVQRMRKYLPSLAAVKGVLMPVASHDSYKLAPIFCALAFGIIELGLNIQNPDTINRTLDVYFESINSINEWISFESSSVRIAIPTVENDLASLMAELPNMYVQALRIVANVQHAWDRNESDLKWDKVKSRLAKLSDEVTIWEAGIKTLKSYRGNLASKKKLIEDKVLETKDINDVLGWIKHDDDREPGQKVIAGRMPSEEQYDDYAQWFLSSPGFKAWTEGFKTPKDNQSYKQALWLRGPYGTGKTTVFYRAYLYLKALEAIQLPEESFRIVTYYCDGRDTRPTYEFIIRSIVQKLSFKPDLSLDPIAQLRYNTARLPMEGPLEIQDWEQLLDDILSGSPTSLRIIVLVDGLDDCSKPEDPESFLDRMGEILSKYCQVRLLCTSRQHVRVQRYFDQTVLLVVDVMPAATASDMTHFIDNEITNRRVKIGDDSVFFKHGHEDLLQEMRDILNERAKGMFIWVEAWLNILIATHNPQKIVQGEPFARKLLIEMRSSASELRSELEQMTAAYRRLWAFNYFVELEDSRTRLFRIVLCSFEPLSIQQLTEALRIHFGADDTYDERLSIQQVRTLFSNFLIENVNHDVEFVHGSARSFVEDMTDSTNGGTLTFAERDNHYYMAQLYIRAMKPSPNEVWQEHSAFEPSRWYDDYYQLDPSRIRNHSRIIVPPMTSDFVITRSVVRYLGKHGLRHCHAAAARRSIFDELWIEVFDEVIIPINPIFTYSMIASYWIGETSWRPSTDNWKNVDIFNMFTRHAGVCKPLYPHILAWLDITCWEDFSQDQMKRCFTDSSNRNDHEKRLSLLLGDPALLQDLVVQETALYIASLRSNEAALSLLLQGTCHRDGRQRVLDLLTLTLPESVRTRSYTAFTFAVVSEDTPILKLLLHFEIQVTREIHNDQAQEEICIAKQWALTVPLLGPAFLYVLRTFNEDDISELLKIARPQNINRADGYYGQNALHFSAARGFFRLTKELVESHGLDFRREDYRKRTPAFFAFCYGHNGILEYLKSKGAEGDFTESDKIPIATRQEYLLDKGKRLNVSESVFS